VVAGVCSEQPATIANPVAALAVLVNLKK
jgi:hypothetical protein